MTQAELLKDLSNFCKGRKTAQLLIGDLYKEFIDSGHEALKHEFELALLSLNKIVVTKLRGVCSQYVKSPFGYQKFLREQQPITRELWNALTNSKLPPILQAEKIVQPPIIPVSNENDVIYDIPVTDRDLKPSFQTTEKKKTTDKKFLSLLPPDWGTMHWNNKEKFISDIIDPEFLRALLRIETVWGVKNMCSRRLKQLSYITKDPAEKILIREDENSSAENFKEYLPLTWNDMDFPARIEFVKYVQDPDFREYLMSIDSHVAKYFSKLKISPKNNIKMCRTIMAAPLDLYPPKARELAKKIVDNLNRVAGISLEYMECSNSKTLEIRQVLR